MKTMDKKIIMPSNELMGKMIENDWEAFRKQCIESGLEFKDGNLEEFVKDMFVGGYCYGHNNCLSIVRGQLETMDFISDIFRSNPS